MRRLTSTAGILACFGVLVWSAPASATALNTASTYSMGVLVLKYFPLTPDGQNIDIGVTGDVGEPTSVVKDRVNSITASLPQVLSAGTAYHGYSDPSATPSIIYNIVDTKEFDRAVPTVPNFPADPNYASKPDYPGILNSASICNYVENKGVDEVWLWAYQGPHQLAIAESKMAGPHGDVSNSYRLNDMPRCSRTYTVYTFNYGRRIAEAVHSHSHQLEAELASIDSHLFTDLWEGPAHPGALGVPGRCGSVHNPPNARVEYDYGDAASNPSDCLHWAPDSLGPLTAISCANWSCAGGNDVHNPEIDYFLWWMQNFPGKGNSVQYQGHQMRNWWDVHARFDAVVGCGESLTLAVPSCTAAQSIAFTSTPPTNAVVGASYTVAATATSGLTVTFSADPSSTGICKVAGATVSFVGVGVCRISADQEGNGSFDPAPRVLQAVTVSSPISCVVTGLIVGPPKRQQVTVNSAMGLASITSITITNGTVSVAPFTPGTTAPVVVTATKTDQTQRTTWGFLATDRLGYSTNCV